MLTFLQSRKRNAQFVFCFVSSCKEANILFCFSNQHKEANILPIIDLISHSNSMFVDVILLNVSFLDLILLDELDVLLII